MSRWEHAGNDKKSFNHVIYAKAREILDLLYLYYHKAYDHQIWKTGDLLWETSTQKVIKTFEDGGPWS